MTLAPASARNCRPTPPGAASTCRRVEATLDTDAAGAARLCPHPAPDPAARRRFLAQTSSLLLAAAAHGQAPARQEEVARQGAQVMPFSLAATRHVFTKSADGGTQQVVSRVPGDAAQTGLIRAHLQHLQAQLAQRDFSMPRQIHGADMPGLAELSRAPPQALQIDFEEIPDGAQLHYRTAEPAVRQALHAWFDAQLADHGRDAAAGHEPIHHEGMHPERGP